MYVSMYFYCCWHFFFVKKKKLEKWVKKVLIRNYALKFSKRAKIIRNKCTDKLRF